MQNEKIFNMPATGERADRVREIEAALVAALGYVRGGSLSMTTERTRHALDLMTQAAAEVSAHVRGAASK